MPALAYGPFTVNGGIHQQDEPVGRSIKVSKIEQNFLTDDKGRKVEIVSNGTRLLVDGKRFSAYRNDQRVTPLSLSEGDEIELAEQRTYGPPTTPQSLRREGVVYEPFKSPSNLVDPKLKHNRPTSIKFSLNHELAQGDEIADLRRQNEELRAQLGAKMDAAEAGKKAAENADRDDRKNQVQQQGQPKKLVP